MLESCQFERNETKARANAARHGVSFEEASTVFGDPLAILLLDPDHSLGEERFLVMGMSCRRRVLVVSHTERPPRTRLNPCETGHTVRERAI